MSQTNPDLALSFGDVTITNGATLPILNRADFFVATGTVTGPGVFTELELWRHDGDDRVREERTSSFDQSYRFVEPGVYTAVIAEDFVSILIQTWFDKVMATIVPTAHAAIGDRTIIEFTVTDTITPPEPTGPSSVLFLPGIQASRLYAGEDISVFGILNDIDEGETLWEPTGNGDVRALGMTAEGESVNRIYTEDILTEVYGVLNIYESFARHLDGLISDNVIDNWTPFAYDWRFSVTDVARNGTSTKMRSEIQLKPLKPWRLHQSLAR